MNEYGCFSIYDPSSSFCKGVCECKYACLDKKYGRDIMSLEGDSVVRAVARTFGTEKSLQKLKSMRLALAV